MFPQGDVVIKELLSRIYIMPLKDGFGKEWARALTITVQRAGIEHHWKFLLFSLLKSAKGCYTIILHLKSWLLFQSSGVDWWNPNWLWSLSIQTIPCLHVTVFYYWACLLFATWFWFTKWTEGFHCWKSIYFWKLV